ncbi:DENTIN SIALOPHOSPHOPROTEIN-LIKE PROTEIN [Salix purpurea]|uniref:DENTIN SIALOPHOSPHOPROTEIN-LIKE PROTEIN n=1 Tax=Salix purpurea TaxID=77065 RepID=A0A9Q0USB7_SALPP|nr:DENTIN SIALOPHOSPHOPROTEIN-LIKE PROTEIN [Salix purpurea]KAJ6735271.1 DENTIN SIALOPHOSPHOPROTEIN-LIKE PROTEIN [Salix purpurea]KAJ6735272.1 DENTIN SIALOPHOSPHOPROTEIN-LIKE PROTEIN [Salix purpurea]
MMSAVGLELTNFIDPYLTWKTVTKGHRSTSRRKPVVRSFNGKAKLLDESTRNVDDMTVSDNEKYGVAVLGCRFSGKNENEHVPIKKRRHTAQGPPQPTCTTFPCVEVVEPNSSGKRRCRATDAAVPNKLNLKTSEVHDKFDYSDDFSGIEILAAVACNNGMINDAACEESLIMEESTRGVGSSSSAVPPKEIVASIKDMAHEDRPEAFQNSEVTVLHTSAGTDDSVTGEGSLLSRDEMLNLDLNVAWEQACDTLSCDSSENDLLSCEVKPEALEQQEPPESVVLSDLLGDNTPDDLISLSLGTCESSREEPKSEACSLHYGKHEEHFPSPSCNAPEPSICDVAIAEASNQVIYGDESLDHPSCNTLPSLTHKQCSEMCSSDDQVRKVFCTESVQVESCNVSPHCQPNSERVPNEIDLSISNGNGENYLIASCPHEDGKLNASSLENCPPIGPAWLGVDSGGREEESGDQQYSPNRRDIYSSCLSSEKGQPVMEVDANGTNEASAANKAEAHSPVQARSEELMQKSSADSTVTPGDACETHANGFTNGSAKVNMEDLEDSFESDFYQADKVHIVGINSVEPQAGYDSQFEDGELRESDAQYCWDENGEDGEVEQVDYESECNEERLPVLDNEKEMKVEIGSSSGSDYVSRKIEQRLMEDSLRDDSLSPKTRTSDVTIDKDFLSGVVGSKASNRDFLSSIEDPNAIFRKHITLRSRANSIYNLCHRDERDVGSQKIMGRDRAVPQMRDRSPGAHRSVNDAPGYCDSERRYFCTYRGNYTSGSSRTRVGFDSRRYRITSDHAVSQGAGLAGSDSRTRRRFVNPSNSSCERMTRRRSPASRDDLYRAHTGMLPVRDGSPVRSGFRRFAGGVATGGLRGEYHRPMLEDKIDYPNRRMFRRERSISPLCRGQPCYPFTHKKSRSRSRSRSPYLTRDRNEARLRSRSPDFRTDARMDRVRLPFQKRIPADFEEGFIPTRRNHFTQHNPRWFDDRNGGLDGFRGRKSPVNIFRSDQRFDSVRTFQRLESEDQFREMIRSRKLNFNDARSASRRGEFDGSDDGRRKHNNRYEMVQRVRRYDTDGDLRRFRVNAEDSLVANNVTPNCDDGNIMTDRRPGEE